MITAEPTVVDEQVIVDRSPELRRQKSRPDTDSGMNPFTAVMYGGDFHVTQDDIDNATRGNGATCALARAWKREHPDDDACFQGEEPWITMWGIKTRVHLHDYVIDWIGRFDRGEPVEPLYLRLND